MLLIQKINDAPHSHLWPIDNSDVFDARNVIEYGERIMKCKLSLYGSGNPPLLSVSRLDFSRPRDETASHSERDTGDRRNFLLLKPMNIDTLEIGQL